MKDVDRVSFGGANRVELAAIEQGLAELWRAESQSTEAPVTRAALWNVIAHAGSEEDSRMAGQVLSQISATVPQRSIIIRAIPDGDPDMTASISASCHLGGGDRQICSEAISITAAGERTYHVPPLVNALLIPELPVAAWWIGDLPHQREDYVMALLEPANRLILDSAHFCEAEDFALFVRICKSTNTLPADLNWERLEEWRSAAASVFDPPAMRSKLQSIRSVRIVSAASEGEAFGESVESLLFASWLVVQLGYQLDREGYVHSEKGPVEFRFEHHGQPSEAGTMSLVEIQFRDGSRIQIDRDRESSMIKVNGEGLPMSAAVMRAFPRDLRHLLIRQLSHPGDDPVFRRVLEPAAVLARHLNR